MKKIYEAPEMKMTKISAREDILVLSDNQDDAKLKTIDMSAVDFWEE